MIIKMQQKKMKKSNVYIMWYVHVYINDGWFIMLWRVCVCSIKISFISRPGRLPPVVLEESVVWKFFFVTSIFFQVVFFFLSCAYHIYNQVPWKARTPALNDDETMEMLSNKENFKVIKLIFIVVNKITLQTAEWLVHMYTR